MCQPGGAKDEGAGVLFFIRLLDLSRKSPCRLGLPLALRTIEVHADGYPAVEMRRIAYASSPSLQLPLLFRDAQRPRSPAGAFALCDTAADGRSATLASFRKQGSNPLARCCLKYLFASAIPIGRPRTALQ